MVPFLLPMLFAAGLGGAVDRVQDALHLQIKRNPHYRFSEKKKDLIYLRDKPVTFEDVAGIGLSLLSGSHMTIFPRVVELLRERDAADIVVFGGGIIPEDDIAAVKQVGVDELFTPGASLSVIVRWVEAQRQE